MTIPDELSTNASEAKKLVVVGSAGCGKSALIHQYGVALFPAHVCSLWQRVLMLLFYTGS